MRIVAILSLVVLISCGTDGEPIKPFGGVGIGIGTDGISAGASVGASKGPISVGVGF